MSPSVLQAVTNFTEESASSTSTSNVLSLLIFINSHTKHSTATWLKRFNQWALHRQIQIYDITDIPKAELDGVLQKFYAELVKENGQEYEPTMSESLKAMIASLSRHIKEQYGYSILNDKDFELSRKVLNGKAIQLQQSGKGKRSKKADPFTYNEADVLWETVLCKMNPVSLNYTIISQHFGTTGRQEHHQMKIEDFKLCYTIDGKG